MIVACIVLLAVAVALGGYIAYIVARDKRKAVGAADGRVKEELASEPVGDNDGEDVAFEIAKEQELAPVAAEAETNDGKRGGIQPTKPEAEKEKPRYIVIKYSKSFLAKLIQSGDETKRYYSVVKNRLLSYDGIKSRTAWKCEAFRKGRKTLAKLRWRGKTLSLCLALNAEDYAGTKYKVESLAGVKSCAATPCMYRIKNDRRRKRGEELIAALMAQNGIAEKSPEKTDYAAMYPYETTETLIGRKLIKVLTDGEAQSGTAFKPGGIRGSVTAQEVDGLMQDEVAATLIKKSDGTSDRTKTGIVNIDALSRYFESGETVTLDEIKKRVKGFNRQITYIKVLARGSLDKALTVEADGFSLQAVKMIVLTGGAAVKKR